MSTRTQIHKHLTPCFSSSTYCYGYKKLPKDTKPQSHYIRKRRQWDLSIMQLKKVVLSWCKLFWHQMHRVTLLYLAWVTFDTVQKKKKTDYVRGSSKHTGSLDLHYSNFKMSSICFLLPWRCCFFSLSGLQQTGPMPAWAGTGSGLKLQHGTASPSPLSPLGNRSVRR